MSTGTVFMLTRLRKYFEKKNKIFPKGIPNFLIFWRIYTVFFVIGKDPTINFGKYEFK